MIKSILILIAAILPLTFWGQNYKNRSIVGEDSAKQMMKNIVSDSTYKVSTDSLITDKETAISLAEVLLFKKYGKALIGSEKPFECYFIDGYWFVRGTLPKNYAGNVFQLIMSAKDGRIIKMSHGSQ